MLAIGALNKKLYVCVCVWLSSISFAEEDGIMEVLNLRRQCAQPWRKLLDYERLLCFYSAKHIWENYVKVPAVPVCDM